MVYAFPFGDANAHAIRKADRPRICEGIGESLRQVFQTPPLPEGLIDLLERLDEADRPGA